MKHCSMHKMSKCHFFLLDVNTKRLSNIFIAVVKQIIFLFEALSHSNVFSNLSHKLNGIFIRWGRRHTDLQGCNNGEAVFFRMMSKLNFFSNIQYACLFQLKQLAFCHSFDCLWNDMQHFILATYQCNITYPAKKGNPLPKLPLCFGATNALIEKKPRRWYDSSTTSSCTSVAVLLSFYHRSCCIGIWIGISKNPCT